MKDAFGNTIKPGNKIIYVAYEGGRGRSLGVAEVTKVREKTCDALNYFPPRHRYFTGEEKPFNLKKSETIYVLNGDLPEDLKL